MKKVLRANTYFVIILLLQIFLPIYKIFNILNISDTRIKLFLSHIIIFIIPAMIYLIINKQSPKKVFKINKLYLKDALLLILLAFICQPIMMFFSLLSQFFFENEIGNFVGTIVDTPYIILLLLIAVLPAVTEEITIRGVVLSGYENINTYFACTITGLLFGIMHLDPQQFLYATVLGFILALVVRITNSIFASALIHFLVNGTSITLQKIISTIDSNTEMIEQASNIGLRNMSIPEKGMLIIFYGCIALAFAILAFFIIRKIKNLNVQRGIISKGEFMFRSYYNEEKVFNLPFIAIIVIYLFIMIRQIVI